MGSGEAGAAAKPAAAPRRGRPTTALKTEQAAETQRRIAEARAAREAKAAAEAAAKAKAEAPVRYVPREKPGAARRRGGAAEEHAEEEAREGPRMSQTDEIEDSSAPLVEHLAELRNRII